MVYLLYPLFWVSLLKLGFDLAGGNLFGPYSIAVEAAGFAFFISILVRTSMKKNQKPKESLRDEVEKLRKGIKPTASPLEKPKRTRGQWLRIGLENFVIVLVTIFVSYSFVGRFQNSTGLQNQARVKKELNKIYALEHGFFLQNKRFGNFEEIGFKEKYLNSGIRYSVSSDSAGFTAYGSEVTGQDPFGDRKAGNEYIAINITGLIFQGAYTPRSFF
jgi:hypothetical protein